MTVALRVTVRDWVCQQNLAFRALGEKAIRVQGLGGLGLGRPGLECGAVEMEILMDARLGTRIEGFNSMVSITMIQVAATTYLWGIVI